MILIPRLQTLKKSRLYYLDGGKIGSLFLACCFNSNQMDKAYFSTQSITAGAGLSYPLRNNPQFLASNTTAIGKLSQHCLYCCHLGTDFRCLGSLTGFFISFINSSWNSVEIILSYFSLSL